MISHFFSQLRQGDRSSTGNTVEEVKVNEDGVCKDLPKAQHSEEIQSFCFG